VSQLLLGNQANDQSEVTSSNPVQAATVFLDYHYLRGKRCLPVVNTKFQLLFPGSFICQKVSLAKKHNKEAITSRKLKKEQVFYHDFRMSSSDSVKPFDMTAALPSSMLKIPTPN